LQDRGGAKMPPLRGYLLPLLAQAIKPASVAGGLIDSILRTFGDGFPIRTDQAVGAFEDGFGIGVIPGERQVASFAAEGELAVIMGYRHGHSKSGRLAGCVLAKDSDGVNSPAPAASAFSLQLHCEITGDLPLAGSIVPVRFLG